MEEKNCKKEGRDPAAGKKQLRLRVGYSNDRGSYGMKKLDSDRLINADFFVKDWQGIRGNRHELIAFGGNRRTMGYTEKRVEPRTNSLTDHRAEFKFPGVPVYQFKVRHLSEKGAGVVVRADSRFLDMVQVGQEVSVNLLCPNGLRPTGHFKSRIEHISELEKGLFKGHLAVGISLHENIPFYGY